MGVEVTRQVIEDDPHDHDRGLAFDLSTVISRRRALQIFAVGGLATLIGCGSNDEPNGATGTSGTTSAEPTSATTATAAGTAVEEIPGETAGPFPADGSNGPNVLTEGGIVRQDITSSFGSSSGVAAGVPLIVNLTILDVAQGGVPVAGAAVYLWHCDRDGNYSLYSSAAQNVNYLRGVQEAGADGTLSFTSIFPAAYQGRWPHIHFEVYPDLDAATSAGTKLVTSQLAIPKETCDLVYASDDYAQSARTFSGMSLDTDNVFRDGYSTQLATASGSVADGITLQLNVGV
jgi:protocatechuate 3,4-dioxygenase beta subunit